MVATNAIGNCIFLYAAIQIAGFIAIPVTVYKKK